MLKKIKKQNKKIGEYPCVDYLQQYVRKAHSFLNFNYNINYCKFKIKYKRCDIFMLTLYSISDILYIRNERKERRRL